jgi:HK97 family phage major capsid protein
MADTKSLSGAERRDRIAELRAKRDRLKGERDRLVDDHQDELSGSFHGLGAAAGIEQRAERLDRGIERAQSEIDDLVELERADIASAARGGGPYRVVAGSDFAYDDPYDSPHAAGRVRDDARRTLDAVESRSGVPAGALERAEGLLNTPDPRARRVAADWVRATGSPEYEQAFLKLLAEPERGHLLWTGAEAEAYRRAEHVRAMSLTDGSGGYLVPFQLDPSIILTSAGSNNPIRQICRTVVATGDVWNGVSSAGVTAEWLAEATEAADASPTLAQPTVTIHKYDAFVPFSFEIGMDGADFLEELRVVMLDGVDQLQATAFTTGSGSGQPFGIVTALAGSASEVNAAADDTFASGDVYSLQSALPARFSAAARWNAHVAVINLIARFETAAGARLFPEITDGRLLNKPLHENSNMDSTVTTSGAVSNFILLYGDFSNYVVADRIGSTLELIPNLFGANRRPTGQRGAFLWGRVGADSVNDNAFRLLDVASAA